MSKSPKPLKPFTVLYRHVTPLAGRNADPLLYTYLCAAVDETDATRQLTAARAYRMSGKTFIRGFSVVRAYTGDGIGTFVTLRGKTERKVVVKTSKMPSWMKKSLRSR